MCVAMVYYENVIDQGEYMTVSNYNAKVVTKTRKCYLRYIPLT